MQSSNVSSTEFINDHQNNEEDQNYIQNAGNDMIQESNIQLSFQKQKQLEENQFHNYTQNQLTLANIQEGFQSNHNDGEISPDKIKQKKKQLFDPREHQSLMELPQREIQSVYSPSQQQNTPSQNDLSLKLEVNPSKRVNSSAHLSIDLKIIEDKQKRQSVIKQKLSEMQDHSIDNSVKAISNDQQSQIAKFGSQFDRDDNNKYQIQSLLHYNQHQGLSHYNNMQNKNSANNNTSFSSAQNHRNNRNSQNYLQSNQQSNQDGQQNMSNLQIEKSGINNILLTPDSNKFGDEGITSSKMKKIKLSQNAFPAILQQKRDRLVNLFLQKLKDSTVLLRKPFNLKMRHYSIINDLSLITTYNSHKTYQYSAFVQFFGKVFMILSSKLPNIQMLEPNCLVSVLNSMVQSILILILIFSTTVSMVFPTGQPFIDDFLNKWLAIICICLFVVDIFVHFNTNTVEETDEKKIIPINSRYVVAYTYIKGVFLVDFSAIVILIIDTQIDLHMYSSYLYFLRIFIFLKIFSLIQHQTIIYNYFITKGYYIIVYNLVQIMFVIFTVAHFFSLAWFGIAYRLHNQDNLENWLDQQQIYHSSWYVQYLNSLFWGLSQLTLYGSYKPNTTKELILSCFSMALGYIFFSFLLLWIKSIYDKCNQNINEESSQKNVQMISSYMAKKSVSKSLQSRVLYHIQQDSKRKQKKEIEDKENKIFESLPIELRKEISEQSNLKILQKIDIFNKIFSQKTLDSLLFYIEEINYLPNQVIYSENNPDDFSIFYIVDGSVGVYQGDQVDFQNMKYIQTLKKGQVFGEICFFTGQLRQVSMVALDYVKVGKVKRESVLQIVKNQQDDLERFCMLKDSYILYEDISCLGVNCYSCGKITHTINDCPLIHPQFDKVKIMHRHIYSAEQIRNQSYKRRKKYSQSQYFIIKKAVKVQQQLKDDSICFQKLNDLIEQLNIYELDEENYEEEEEFDDDEDYAGNSKTIPEEEETSQPNEQDKMRDDNYTLKNFSDQEDEGLKLQQQQQQSLLLLQQQQIMKQSKQSSGNNNNNNNNSGRGESNTPNTASNPHAESSSQLSKQVKSLRKDSSSSQMNGDPMANKEYRKEMTYNTVYTDQQFQGYEYFLQESTSNNNNNPNINTSNNINSNNPTLNMVSNNATLNNINTNASVEARVSIPDLTQHLIYDHQPPQRIQNKKLTTQTAPQIYSRTKSFASRKSKKQNSSPDQQAQSANEKSILQDLILDPSLCKEFTRDYTLSSKKSNKRHLKFADESILGMKSDNNLKNNNPTSTSIQLSPYQESLSSKESNYQNSAQQSTYVIQQFQSLLLKFQSVFRQMSQAQRYNSLAQSLDQMKNCDRDSDLQYDLNSHKNSIKDIDHKSSSNQTNKKIETSAVLYKQYTSALSRQGEEWNLDKLKNYKIYYPHNNFSFIYPQIQLVQRLKIKEIQAIPNIPIKISPSQPQAQYQQTNIYLLHNNEYPQINIPNSQNDHLMEPRKTISTNLTQNRTRKSQYSLTYGVQINSKPFRHFGSLNSGNSSVQRITSNQNNKYQKNQLKQKNISQSNSDYSYIKKS
ncbi:cyclic nucleotide-binding domain protein (macronuclear) [Tetrahymena thermophila SB210]|uniref:Cyclic nucleotide-binding domain protein n=1 Tax=Tetrahymena thermophila (strain SB210) TaxID=312017 RepID=I7M6K4_TETTS|nr:cyclic nucleotide-binding domain protein [Tetrahymena thermophila SB210]EAR85371.2 cyclic nucleotide-binding domain protein [Tetrahymena thermophila SB210]|eukprot:XP_001033034.2 cyclic nucleotide-binding domain protein [Tetrahymena thermophila SB210]